MLRQATLNPVMLSKVPVSRVTLNKALVSKVPLSRVLLSKVLASEGSCSAKFQFSRSNAQSPNGFGYQGGASTQAYGGQVQQQFAPDSVVPDISVADAVCKAMGGPIVPSASDPVISSVEIPNTGSVPNGGYSAPTYSAPTYSAPVYSAPTYAAPAYSAPASLFARKCDRRSGRDRGPSDRWQRP